ncbi:leucine-rich repeat and calponin homology domain-containing protein 1 isoform X2 [Orussus abietinus]|uniref:leucine-rich repeat and calponin homology domain-containing protein 1 isoform X2 n=1 Tax=Orussus abietinus TaxID=222816 RepID=UPI0006269351|nr:leucine-rich repeat and calponin homology domain-containing protein 1 isoform X2 [Orussus abietinus]
MAMVASNMSDHIQKQLTRSLERILEEAHLSGELKLSNRKLKDFPKVGKGNAKFNLQDTVIADLSKNRFTELPDEVTEFPFLEKLHLYHNAIRIIPETVAMLQSLSYLDLSRNQLTALPREVCRLPLQTLLVAHNRLSSLPDELGRMSALAELDAGCNEISSLPPRIGDLPRLRCLDLRSNLLVQLPIELTYLRLVKLDISGNRISVLPNELRKMKSLDDLRISDNPLTSPPASLCVRGRTHVFKYLERQAAKHERARAGRQARRGPLDGRGHVTLDTRSHKRHNVDSGYSTSDGVSEKRWSQEIHSAAHDDDLRGVWRPECSPLSIALPHESGMNGSYSGTSTPSTISPGEHASLEDELGKAMLLHDQLEKRRLERSASENGVESRRPVISCMRGSIPVVPSGQLESAGLSQQQQRQVQQDPTTLPVQFPQTVANPTPMIANGEDKRPLNHIQTYREYKEALRQQRANEGPSVYRSRDQMTPPGNEPPGDRTDCVGILGKSSANDESANRRPVQKVTPSRANYRSIPIVNGSGGEHNGQLVDQPYKKPSSPVKSHSPTSLAHPTSAIARTSSSFTEGNESPSRNGGSPKSAGRSVTWHSSLPEKYSFTMRREFERAKEEADLIEQLRNNIETRLKMALPEDLAPALTDGVVLCHLANHVRPRSVGSIHVPSPAVPKLTMARCRRNVDNFLEACRKIGVDEKLVCCASDVLEGGRGIVRVAVTVSELLRFHQARSPLQQGTAATAAAATTSTTVAPAINVESHVVA